MRSAVICHAAQDAAFARELGAFLELNCPVTVFHEEGLIHPDEDLVDAAERAISADVALLLLSPDSVPGAWKRERWEPVLFDQPREFHTDVAFLFLADCRFPELFRRKAFFDLSQDSIAGRRSVKRWLLAQEQPLQSTIELPARAPARELTAQALDELQRRLTDRPGWELGLDAEIALAFAEASKHDFEGVFWIECARRSPAGILGDAGHTLGLQLSGPVEQDRAGLLKFCAERRCLLIFDHIDADDAELFAAGGKTSFIFTARGSLPAAQAVEATTALFESWGRNPGQCVRALGDAQSHLRTLSADGEWEAVLRLGAPVFTFLAQRNRLAEAYEILAILLTTAREGNDLSALRRFTWEQSWILESWGEPSSSARSTQPGHTVTQLTLNFTV